MKVFSAENKDVVFVKVLSTCEGFFKDLVFVKVLSTCEVFFSTTTKL